MIRLSLKPSNIKNLSFNKIDETLEIEFKHHINTAQCINIPLSIIEDYIESLNEETLEFENDNQNPPTNLTVVYSNYKVS
ncbi:hypothetical protein [Algibacter sp. PT7-4]|uniref:hypothetical protein n=1 Tax=Algibacter ulvanivorans TaxID=3400999 RepID=UPI003AAC6255